MLFSSASRHQSQIRHSLFLLQAICSQYKQSMAGAQNGLCQNPYGNPQATASPHRQYLDRAYYKREIPYWHIPTTRSWLGRTSRNTHLPFAVPRLSSSFLSSCLWPPLTLEIFPCLYSVGVQAVLLVSMKDCHNSYPRSPDT